MSETSEPRGPATDAPTSLHVCRALAGDGESLAWVVSRFSPLLLAQAEYRLGARLRRWHDPEDLVHDVWLRALPRLAGLEARDARFTPVLLRFLTTTLLHQVANLFRKHVQGKPRVEGGAGAGTSSPQGIEGLPLDASGVVTQVVGKEARSVLRASLARLEPGDREVVVLRGIEQRSTKEVAALLGIGEEAASSRYRRALARLRAELPGAVLDLLPGG